MKAVTVLAAAAIAAQPQHSDQQFNLVCSGTIHSFFENTASMKDEPYSYTYRIDLKSGNWCEAECTVVRPIADVQPTILRLEPNRNEDAPTHREKWTSLIDRTDGSQMTMVESWDDLLGNSTMTWKGTCERRPFSGFPEVKTKF
jgi:hypothetical protein